MTIVLSRTTGLARNVLAVAATVPKFRIEYGRHATSSKDGAPAIAVAADAAESACPPSPAGRTPTTRGYRAEGQSRTGRARPRKIDRDYTGAGKSD